METWVIIASGPSLDRDDVRTVYDWRFSGVVGRKVAVINRTWELAPWADLLYAGDARWWNKYNPGEEFKGEKFTLSATAASRHQIEHVGASFDWSTDPTRVFAGGLSGIAAINLVAHRRPVRVVLLGYDCCYADNGRRHWHADYNASEGFPNVPRLHEQKEAFKAIAEKARFPVINTSRMTAIDCFPCMRLADALR